MEQLITEIRKYKALFEQLETVMFYVKDHQGRYVYFNNTIVRIMGLSPLALYEKPSSVFHGYPNQMKMMEIEDNKILSGEIKTSDRIIDLQNISGEFMSLKVIKAAIFNPECEIIGITGIGYDITDHREGERIFLQNMVDRLSPMERLYYFISSRTPESKEKKREICRELNITDEHGDKIRHEVYKKLGFREHSYESRTIMKLYKKYLGNIYDE